MFGWWNEPNSKHAFMLSWISVIMTFLAAFLGISYYTVTGSALCLVFGLENCVDLFSSVVVLWRFYCPGGITKAREELLQKREKRASLAISFILMFLGISVSITAIHDLQNGAETAHEFQLVLFLAFVSIFLFGSLTLIKFQYSHKLNSASLYKDGLCSLIGTILSVALFINTMIIESVPSAWWLDPFVALLCGIGSLGLGLHAIIVASCVQGIPIFTLKWWFVSQGDGTDETEGRELNPLDMGVPPSTIRTTTTTTTTSSAHDSGDDPPNGVEMTGKNKETGTQLSEVV